MFSWTIFAYCHWLWQSAVDERFNAFSLLKKMPQVATNAAFSPVSVWCHANRQSQRSHACTARSSPHFSQHRPSQIRTARSFLASDLVTLAFLSKNHQFVVVQRIRDHGYCAVLHRVSDQVPSHIMLLLRKMILDNCCIRRQKKKCILRKPL